ncbi:MAG: hypothetical protein Ct9H300mP25_03900 [Acidobacteriota bacterium]|nr:MAG: hypothetical protein Ct9H300mP25_03900 [Acidobacteriota bacterium]
MVNIRPLTMLDDGNLIKTTDFRRVYATMIKEWLKFDDAEEVLKGSFDPIGAFAKDPCLGIETQSFCFFNECRSFDV